MLCSGLWGSKITNLPQNVVLFGSGLHEAGPSPIHQIITLPIIYIVLRSRYGEPRIRVVLDYNEKCTS